MRLNKGRNKSRNKSRNKRVTDIVFLSLFFAFFAIGSAMASTQKLTQKLTQKQNKSHSLAGMSSTSEQVVVGRVKSLSARWVGKVIVTTAEIEPVEFIKGKPSKALFNLSYVGGRVGVIEQQLSYPTQLEEGETAVFFVQNAPSKTALAGSKMLSHIEGKIPLLLKGETLSRLNENARISKLLNEIRDSIQ